MLNSISVATNKAQTGVLVPSPGLAPQAQSSDWGSQPTDRINSQSSTGFTFTPVRGESDRAFEAFRFYWELGSRRRLAAVGRKVGASLRTVQRWANDFDWRGRIKTHTAGCVRQSVQFETDLHREELLDAAARAKTFRERQFILAEAILDTAERYLERLEEGDLEQLRFVDACRALTFAAQLANQGRETEATTTPDQSLRKQLAVLLDQACAKNADITKPQIQNS
jgi:hypothetical protein